MAINSIRPYMAKHFIDPLAKKLIPLGISPNALSIISFIFSVFAGILYYLSGLNIADYPHAYYLLLIAGICVLINSGFDALDGSLARQKSIDSKRGDFLDHVIDRYADVFIISGLVFGNYCPWTVGIIALAGVLLTSYLGTQAQAMDIGRYYGGIMGRADRLILILMATFSEFIYIVYNNHPISVFGFSFLGWCLIIIAAGSHITAFQRIYHIWSLLGKEEKESK